MNWLYETTFLALDVLSDKIAKIGKVITACTVYEIKLTD